MLALAVLLSIVGLGSGPALVALGRGRAWASAGVEGFTLGVVPALIVLRLLPHLYESLGPLALGLAAAGYLVLWQMDQRRHGAGERFGHTLVVPALAAHAVTDGAGLALSVAAFERGAASAGVLAAAIVLHRLPEGLFLASELVPEIGWRRTLQRLGILAACTVGGALVGSSLVERVSDAVFDGAVAVGLGVILRLVVHSHTPRAGGRLPRALGGATFVLGVVLASAIPPAGSSVLERSQPSEMPVVRSLLPLFVNTAPAMLLGLVGAGLLAALWPAASRVGARANGVREGALRAAARGVLQSLAQRADGVALLRSVRARLLDGEAPTSPVALAASATELTVDTMSLSFRLLGPALGLLRLVASAALAMTLALVTARAGRGFTPAAGRPPSLPPAPDHAHGHDHDHDHDHEAGAIHSHSDRDSRGALRTSVALAFGPLLDRVAAWYLVGLVAAATLEAAVRPGLLARVGAPLDVVIGALLAVPLYVGAPGATPVAAMMVHKGFSVGAALAFVLVGPGTNPGLLRVVRASMGPRAAWALATTAFAVALGAGIACNALVPSDAVPGLHGLLERRTSALEWAGAAALGCALLASLLRLGPRDWFGHMAPGGHDLSGHH